MLIDTHCHLNMMAKKTFDTPLTNQECQKVNEIIQQAIADDVTIIINVGTSVIESNNSIELAKLYPEVVATVGIHPNDCTSEWRTDFVEIQKLIQNKGFNKIVGIGECGLDYHYPDFNKQRQKDAFKAHIELSLEHNLPLIIHTRNAGEETLRCLEEFQGQGLRGTVHCFSEGIDFARQAINLGFVLGIGGTITYPKNNYLRDVVMQVGITNIILETDAPFLPPQDKRGQQNHPREIKTIAHYLSNLLNINYDDICSTTTQTARSLFL